MGMRAISLDEKFRLVGEHWRPKVVAALNGQEVKVVKFEPGGVRNTGDRVVEGFTAPGGDGIL
jgi:hypothetical protein